MSQNISTGIKKLISDANNVVPTKSIDEAKNITADHFKKIKMDELLTMNRKTGFYEMIEMMMGKIKNVRN